MQLNLLERLLLEKQRKRLLKYYQCWIIVDILVFHVTKQEDKNIAQLMVVVTHKETARYAQMVTLLLTQLAINV